MTRHPALPLRILIIYVCISALVQACLLRLRRDGADYVRVLTVNTVGPFLMTKLFLPLLRYIHSSPSCLEPCSHTAPLVFWQYAHRVNLLMIYGVECAAALHQEEAHAHGGERVFGGRLRQHQPLRAARRAGGHAAGLLVQQGGAEHACAPKCCQLCKLKDSSAHAADSPLLWPYLLLPEPRHYQPVPQSISWAVLPITLSAQHTCCTMCDDTLLRPPAAQRLPSWLMR